MLSTILAAIVAGQANAAANPPPASAKPKLICRAVKATGSRLERRRVCGTARQWEETEREAQEAARDYQDQSTGAGSMNEPAPGRGPG